MGHYTNRASIYLLCPFWENSYIRNIKTGVKNTGHLGCHSQLLLRVLMQYSCGQPQDQLRVVVQYGCGQPKINLGWWCNMAVDNPKINLGWWCNMAVDNPKINLG